MTTELLDRAATMSPTLAGAPMRIGDHFRAYSFRIDDVGASMKPLLMVDHFWMTRDTFGWHAHSGISAVTYVFADSKSAHHNADSMGDRSAITPGSMHWMMAGSGAMHREHPEGDDALVHGLQFFVALPETLHSAAPYSLQLDAEDVPELTLDSAHVRIVAGQFGDVTSPARLPQPFSLYDIGLNGRGTLEFPLPANWGAWIYAVRGQADIAMNGQSRTLRPFRAVTLQTGSQDGILAIRGEEGTHVVVLAGAPV